MSETSERREPSHAAQPAQDASQGDGPSESEASAQTTAAGAEEEWPQERRRALHEALAEQRLRLARASRGLGILLMATVAAGVVLRLPESWWMPAVGAIALGGIVFRLVTWKCPNCGERLATRRPGAVCGGCGAPLE